MAIHHHHNHQQLQQPSSLFDALYCHEEKWEDDDGEVVDEDLSSSEQNDVLDSTSLLPLLLLEQNLFNEDEELNTLFSKEKIQQETYYEDLKNVMNFDSLSQPRREAVEWMLKVNAHYGFSALTATLAVNYLDRFLLSFHFQKEKPWMIQLVAVTCISLAAKVEETQVPLLLDLQVCYVLNPKPKHSLKFCFSLFLCLFFFMFLLRCKILNMCLKQRLFREWSF